VIKVLLKNAGGDAEMFTIVLKLIGKQAICQIRTVLPKADYICFWIIAKPVCAPLPVPESSHCIVTRLQQALAYRVFF
jgi:hypothetical protein